MLSPALSALMWSKGQGCETIVHNTRAMWCIRTSGSLQMCEEASQSLKNHTTATSTSVSICSWMTNAPRSSIFLRRCSPFPLSFYCNSKVTLLSVRPDFFPVFIPTGAIGGGLPWCCCVLPRKSARKSEESGPSSVLPCSTCFRVCFKLPFLCE